MERLSRSKREHDAARVALEEREAAVVRKLSQLERQLKAAVKGKVEAEDTVANLKLEISSRPSARDFRDMEVRNGELERQVQAAVEALEEAEGRENQIYFHHPNAYARRGARRRPMGARERIEARAQRDADEAHDRRKIVDTKALIKKDKLNHKLGLNRLTALPKSVAHEIIQAACRMLEISNVELIVPSLEKMLAAQREMPKLRQFIRDVRAMSGTSDASQVLPALQKVFAARKETASLRSLRAGIVELVAPAASGSSSSMSDEQILKSIETLASLERALMQRKSTFAEVDVHVADHPTVLVNRIVQHFQQLFEVKSAEGVFPKMNALYVQVSEARNFLQIIRPMLGLPPSASTNACVSAIQNAIDRGDVAAGLAPSPAFAEDVSAPFPSDGQASLGAAAAAAALPSDPADPADPLGEDSSLAIYRENLLGSSQIGLPEWKPPVWR